MQGLGYIAKSIIPDDFQFVADDDTISVSSMTTVNDSTDNTATSGTNGQGSATQGPYSGS